MTLSAPPAALDADVANTGSRCSRWCWRWCWSRPARSRGARRQRRAAARPRLGATDGSKALAVLLHRYGSTVQTTRGHVRDRAGGSAVVVDRPGRLLRCAVAWPARRRGGIGAHRAGHAGRRRGRARRQPSQDGDVDTPRAAPTPAHRPPARCACPVTRCLTAAARLRATAACSSRLHGGDPRVGGPAAQRSPRRRRRRCFGRQRAQRRTERPTGAVAAGGLRRRWSGPASIWALFPAGASRVRLADRRRPADAVARPPPRSRRARAAAGRRPRLRDRRGPRPALPRGPRPWSRRDALRTATLTRLAHRLGLRRDDDGGAGRRGVAPAPAGPRRRSPRCCTVPNRRTTGARRAGRPAGHPRSAGTPIVSSRP